ncbi:MAG TPA: hypothetical protein VKN99_22450 [Polyangia bacterium]|nr:hypothetical protein [Polyangia bacterium]
MAARARLAALLTTLAGCASYKEYTCPQPIGPIVRDDCEAFRVRYDSVKVDIGFSLGGVGAHVGVGQERLRDPSEMIQLLAQRTLTMCHDFNTCRLTNQEYRERRDEADRLLTSITALTGQLKNPSLDAATRQKLVSELLALLESSGRPAPSVAGAGGAGGAGSSSPPPQKPQTRRSFRKKAGVYVKSAIAPPRRPQPARGVPSIVEYYAWPPASLGKINAIHFYLHGYAPDDVQEDDFLEIEGGAVRAKCPVHRGNPILVPGLSGTAECPLEGALPRTVTLSYRPGVSGQLSRLGTLDLGMGWLTERAWVAFEPDPIHLDPVLFERPYLVMYTERTPGDHELDARCRVGGKPVGGVLRAADADDTATFRRFHLPLPFAVRVAPGNAIPQPEDLFNPAQHAGRWSCTVTLDGDPLRDVEFEVLPSARLKPAASDDQAAFAPPWWRVAQKRLK